jgi:hypothetical protein
LTTDCPKLTHQIAKKSDLSINFFKILDYMGFQAKPAEYQSLKSALTDPFVQTIPCPVEREYREMKKRVILGQSYFERVTGSLSPGISFDRY